MDHKRPDPDPVAVLERWTVHGGGWRATSLTETDAVVELLSCDGAVVDALASTDRVLLEYLSRQRSSELSPPRPESDNQRRSSTPANGEESGKASFPASDPPSTWTWEPPLSSRGRP